MGSEELSRRYTAREERFSAWIHLAGTAGFTACGWKLFGLYSSDKGELFLLSLIFYWLSLLFMFTASAVYHMVKSERAKQIARKCDHCAIYLLITGTYAPLMTGVIADWRGYAVLGTLLLLTAAGIIMKFFYAGRFHKLEVILYLLMGWLCMLVIKPLADSLPATGLWLLVAGGVTYTAGVAFYAIRKEFFHAVWHMFVLAGAWLQLLAVLTVR